MRKVLATVLSLLLVLSLCATSAVAASEVLNEPGTFPIVKEGSDVKLVIGLPAAATITDYDDNHLTNWLRDKMGCEIEMFLFDSSEWKTQLQLMTTSGETLPDILMNMGLGAVDRESYGSQGYFVDLLPYFEAGELTYWYENEAITYLTADELDATLKSGLSSDGALYAFPFWAIGIADPWSSGILINNTFCEALGMEIPTTIDEYYEYLVAVKESDPNGNGIADEIPFVGFKNSSWGDVIGIIMNSFTYYPATWSGAALCATDDGEIYVPYQTEEFKEGLRFLNKLYTEGLLSDLSFSQDAAALKTMVDLTGDAPDVIASMTAHRSQMFANHNTAERRTHYTSLGPLVGPEGVAYCATYKCEPGYNHQITTDCANPDVAFALLDYMTSTECTLTARYGREGEYWRWATEEEKALGSAWADAGYTDVLYATGGDTMKVCWGQQNNEIWNSASMTWQPIGFTTLTPKTAVYENPITEYNVNDWNNAVMQRYGKAPKNLVGSFAYTQEENDLRGTSATDVGTYVRECMTLFVTGQMDIENDWEAFQANLQMMGLDNLISTTQAAWDRVNK